MAIWTHWAQIVGGIHLILASSSRKRAKMMDVDESSRLIAIHGIEADATDTTSGCVDLNTAARALGFRSYALTTVRRTSPVPRCLDSLSSSDIGVVLLPTSLCFSDLRQHAPDESCIGGQPIDHTDHRWLKSGRRSGSIKLVKTHDQVSVSRFTTL